MITHNIVEYNIPFVRRQLVVFNPRWSNVKCLLWFVLLWQQSI